MITSIFFLTSATKTTRIKIMKITWAPFMNGSILSGLSFSSRDFTLNQTMTMIMVLVLNFHPRYFTKITLISSSQYPDLARYGFAHSSKAFFLKSTCATKHNWSSCSSWWREGRQRKILSGKWQTKADNAFGHFLVWSHTSIRPAVAMMLFTSTFGGGNGHKILNKCHWLWKWEDVVKVKNLNRYYFIRIFCR